MALAVKRMTDLPLRGKRVLIREDLNAPIRDGTITSDKRLRAALPTIRLAIDKGARVIMMSHLGRPREGRPEQRPSPAPVAA
ncbi:MAG: phosphoglycerate kinase, partial [Rhodospirillaceae bacterium]|nr:phosphoglycerate kinase [Rhodospirillaceae bacterium]